MEVNKETKRIANLYQYDILDSPADEYFDEMTALAAKIFEVPMSIISLVDEDRVWFKSAYGVDTDEIPRDPGLCSTAIYGDALYIIENAKVDPRSLANPLVAGALGLQFYAAAPLTTREKFNLGTFCIMDTEPRSLDLKGQSILRQLARIVMSQIEIRLQSNRQVREAEEN